MAKVDTLQSLFVQELRDLLDAEKQLVRTLPRMARMATAPTLSSALREHLEETRGHVSRLEQALESLGLRASSKKCVGMQGLIEDGEETIEEAEDGPVRDAALIGAAQRTEHYEMAGYGTARTFATLLGHAGIASVLESTLNEEKAADAKLTTIAEAMVNPEAAAEPPAGDDRSGFAARTAEWLGSTAGAAVGEIGRMAGRLAG
ncbi:MAG TPA: ferritin-like domain-containing protein, partial [Vicinamibacterales bacterium]|nr:ferritin-like domain-containing protein [Vicinamibacterales bacterium]